MRLTPDPLDTARAALDRRLSRDSDRPLAICVSGGGDSVALLHLAAIWAQAQSRRLIVLNVDHGLTPLAQEWGLATKAAADSLGAEWRGLRWTADKPKTGVQAAARAARHALLAEAARLAGARVLLMGHTADDIAEADWMRRQGAPLGQLREWAPSPAWPEGRGLMILRPLLNLRRATLRSWLLDQGIQWFEDPANTNPRFLRSRARIAAAAPESSQHPARPVLADFVVEPESGVIRIARNSPWLGHALICASGRAGAVTLRQLNRLRDYLDSGAAVASLAGAVAQSRGVDLILTRELGRAAPAVLPLSIGVDTVWDGRFLFRATATGWSVAPAAGRRSGLSDSERQTLNRAPAQARGPHPVLLRDENVSPVLASDTVEVSCLVPGRLRLATVQAQTEDELAVAIAS